MITNFGTINIRKENGEMILTEDYDVDSWKNWRRLQTKTKF